MNIGQYGLVYSNGRIKMGEISKIEDKRLVLKFYGDYPSSNRWYQVSHCIDSVILISDGSIERNIICRNTLDDESSLFYIIDDIYINDVTGETECSTTVLNHKYYVDRPIKIRNQKVLKENLVPIKSSERIFNILDYFATSTIIIPDDLQNKFFYRKCLQCDKKEKVKKISYFLFGSEELSEEPLCRDCMTSDKKHFDCSRCERDFGFWNNSRQYHRRKNASILKKYENLCLDCYRATLLCNKCIDVIEDKFTTVDSKHLCYPCSEETIKLLYKHPNRTVFPENHIQSKNFYNNESERHAGIEIECIHSWTDLEIPSGWRIVSDASISDERYGAEYVMTLPTNGDSLLKKVSNIANFIKSTGGYVDESCGLHVHINALDMQLEELKNCLAIGKSMETWIYDMLYDSREKSRYSQPLPEFSIKELMNISTYREFVEFWYHKISDAEITSRKYNSSRYRGFNVHSRLINGTIEFRHHQGTLDFNNIDHWIRLCLAVVDTSFNLNKDSKEILIDNPLEYSASDFFYAIGLPAFNNHYNNMKEKNKPKESFKGSENEIRIH